MTRIFFKSAVIICIISLSLSGNVKAELSWDKEAFLDKIQKDTFLYFLKEQNPENGLIKDSSRPGAPCSVAAVGFALTALCIGESRGWIDKDEAYNRILRILVTFRDKVQNERGFYYHFLDMRRAQRTWSSELSSIDTAIFLAGALFAGEYFIGTEIESIAKELYERADWPWMLNGHKVLCMGWKPESGFLPYYWDSYSEHMILYALAIGSPTHPIPRECWEEWDRPVDEYAGYRVVYCNTGSLFVYLQSHAWIDFRNIRDKDIDYWQNSINAVGANRQFCIDNERDFITYSDNSWGLTASLGPWGYKGYGAKPGWPIHDGTISPFVIGGSMPFEPELSMQALWHIYEQYGRKAYGQYGFKDAFNLKKNWFADEYLGIDQGLFLIMAENYRTGLVWEFFMRLEPIKRWLDLCF